MISRCNLFGIFFATAESFVDSRRGCDGVGFVYFWDDMKIVSATEINHGVNQMC